MELEQAVEAMNERITDGESRFAERYGESALSTVQAMRSLIAERLGSDELSYRDLDIGDGDYLYGNVVPGTVVLEGEELLDQVFPDQATQLSELGTEGVVPAPTLDDLQEVVEAYPDLEPAGRQRLESEVHEVLDELSEESAVDVERLVTHLGEIGRIEPDLVSAILERIEADAPALGLPVALAARQMRAWLDRAQSARG